MESRVYNYYRINKNTLLVNRFDTTEYVWLMFILLVVLHFLNFLFYNPYDDGSYKLQACSIVILILLILGFILIGGLTGVNFIIGLGLIFGSFALVFGVMQVFMFRSRVKFYMEEGQ